MSVCLSIYDDISLCENIYKSIIINQVSKQTDQPAVKKTDTKIRNNIQVNKYNNVIDE